MISRILTDEELIAAAAQVRESMLCVLPEPRECTGQFSSQFEAKIEKLRKTAAKKASRRKFTRHAVAAVLVVLIGLSMLCALNTEVRAAFVSWFNETFGEYTTYWFASEENNILPEYELTWVPEGYKIINDEELPDSRILIYQYGDDISKSFSFSYYLAENDSQLSLYTSDGTYLRETVQVNGWYGELFMAQNTSDSNTLVWLDGNTNTVNTIIAYLPKNEILDIANSIRIP